MSLTERAIQDLQRITSNSNEWGVEIVLISTDDTTITINGFATKHHTAFDVDGMRENTAISSVAVSHGLLVDYTYIDADGYVNFTGHKVTTGGKNYIVREFFPDNKLELTVLILEAWQA